MELAPDFDEFIASLTVHGVEFVVVGAYALAFHGAPRFTGDLDILVRPALENAALVSKRSSRSSFLRNKRAAVRPKDRADIDALEPGDE